MKKALILANNSGGLYHFRFELIKKLIEKDYKVFFTVPQTEEDERVKWIIDAGAEYIHTPINRRGTNPIDDFKLIKLYNKVIKQVNPDIILTYTIKPNIYGNYVASKFNKPVIMNITGIGSSLSSGRIKGIIKRMYKYACKKSQVIFFQNEGNREFFINDNLVHKAKTKLIPGSGVNIKNFVPIKRTKEDDVVKFLFIGRLMREKGIEEYLQVAERLTSQYKNVEFQILGSFEEEKYKELLESSKNKRIIYLGKSSDVRQQIKEVDCIVNPSYHEGMSNVLLEGAAMGKPLIACDIPGCREIIDEDHNGYLCEVRCAESLEDKIIQFIELENERKQDMIKNSREKVVNEFDRNIVVNEYIKTIEGILNKR